MKRWSTRTYLKKWHNKCNQAENIVVWRILTVVIEAAKFQPSSKHHERTSKLTEDLQKNSFLDSMFSDRLRGNFAKTDDFGRFMEKTTLLAAR